MSYRSSIDWTNTTWNPVRGCTEVSEECRNCYAKRFAERFRGVKGHPYESGFDLRLAPHLLPEPLRWTSPRMVFTNSMGDPFHGGVPDDYIVKIARVMELANWHTYQVLTKRSDRMAELLKTKLRFAADLPHIWWGVTVGNREDGLPRNDHLRAAPARVRFLSIEPLIEDLGTVKLEGIHWVILGGESGPGARPMEAAWVRSILAQCRSASVPLFFKQWSGVHKHRLGNEIDGRVYHEFPPRVESPVPSLDRRRAYMEEVGATCATNSPSHQDSQDAGQEPAYDGSDPDVS